jgi:hypothetical protein
LLRSAKPGAPQDQSVRLYFAMADDKSATATLDFGPEAGAALEQVGQKRRLNLTAVRQGDKFVIDDRQFANLIEGLFRAIGQMFGATDVQVQVSEATVHLSPAGENIRVQIKLDVSSTIQTDQGPRTDRFNDTVELIGTPETSAPPPA